MDEQVMPQVPPIPQVEVKAVDGPGKDECTWAMFCHLSTLIGMIVPVPFASLLGPFIVWMIKKGEYPLVDDQGKEAINFQISALIYFVLSVVLIIVIIGIPMVIALGVFELVCIIIAAVKANDGVKYRYPLCIRFIK